MQHLCDVLFVTLLLVYSTQIVIILCNCLP